MSRFLLPLLIASLLFGCAPAPGRPAATPDPSARSWWRNAVFYEIFVRSFYDTNGDGIGDFNGVAAKLDYLQRLGVNAIWLMPVNPAGTYHGYDVTDYYDVNPQYGTMEEFKRLVAETHRRGMHLIVDLVLNHTSNRHPFFVDAARGPQAKHYNWYIWSDTDQGQYWHPLPGNPGRFYFGIFGDNMPDLNYRNPEVTAEVQRLTAYWLKDVGVDGFRLDAVKHLIEEGSQIQNTVSTHEWLKGYYSFYKAESADAYAVGEAFDADASIVKSYRGQVDQIFNFELAKDFIGSANTGTNVPTNSGFSFAVQAVPDGNYATFLTNHDQDRVMSELSGDVDKAKLAAFLLLTAPGTPYIYYGEEIGMQGEKPDEDIRLPMQWDSSASAGFTTGQPWRAPRGDSRTVNVKAELGDPGSLLSFYQQLIAVRRERAALRTGQFVPVASSNAGVFAAFRVLGDETLLILANLQDKPISDYTLSTVGSQGSLPRGSWSIEALYGSGDFASAQIGSSGQLKDYRPLASIPPFGMYVLKFTKR